MRMDKKLLGAAIARLRKKAGMSQEDLYNRSGVSQQLISKYERGERYPRIEKLFSIAQALGGTPDQILKAAGVMPPQSGLNARELYEVAIALTPTERQRVMEYAEWRLHEQREQYSATSDDPRQTTER